MHKFQPYVYDTNPGLGLGLGLRTNTIIHQTVVTQCNWVYNRTRNPYLTTHWKYCLSPSPCDEKVVPSVKTGEGGVGLLRFPAERATTSTNPYSELTISPTGLFTLNFSPDFLLDLELQTFLYRW